MVTFAAVLGAKRSDLQILERIPAAFAIGREGCWGICHSTLAQWEAIGPPSTCFSASSSSKPGCAALASLTRSKLMWEKVGTAKLELPPCGMVSLARKLSEINSVRG
jgi:hypothetical protein